jgi:hypothetical protein
MSDAAKRDPVARLIPWYAAGRLSGAESAEVETHLAGCDECRDLLALARGFRRLAPHVPQETLFDHVQAQRLVEFAENPATLEPETRRFVTTHIQSCAPCAEALEILEDMGRSSMAGDPKTMAAEPGTMPESPSGPLDSIRKAMADLWDRLSRTLLGPAPALAYLAALVVLLVAVAVRRPAPGSGSDLVQSNPPTQQVPAPGPTASGPSAPAEPEASAPTRIALLPPAIEMPEEVVFRDDATPPAPLVIKAPAVSGAIVLSLVTSLAAEDLSDAKARFRLVLVQGNRTLLSRECHGADFDRRGRLLVTIDRATIVTGSPWVARLVRPGPGTPAGGEEVYRRSFVFDTATPGPR